MKAYIDFWRRYSDFSGKTTRSNYWVAMLLHYVLTVLLVVFIPIFLIAILELNIENALTIFYLVYSLFALASVVPHLAITVRRLRDAGFSAKSFFWLLVPGVGAIAFLVRLCTKSAE